MKINQKKWSELSKKEKIVGVVIVFFVVGAISNLFGGPKETSTEKPSPIPTTQNEPTPTPTPSRRDLNAEVKFNQVAFQITNKEDHAWTDCRLKLNSKYEYSTDAVIPQDPLIIPFSEFTKGEGTRFNPYDTKAQNLSISCDSEGQHLFGYYEI